MVALDWGFFLALFLLSSGFLSPDKTRILEKAPWTSSYSTRLCNSFNSGREQEPETASGNMAKIIARSKTLVQAPVPSGLGTLLQPSQLASVSCGPLRLFCIVLALQPSSWTTISTCSLPYYQKESSVPHLALEVPSNPGPAASPSLAPLLLSMTSLSCPTATAVFRPSFLAPLAAMVPTSLKYLGTCFCLS